jgi:hypothetical protein
MKTCPDCGHTHCCHKNKRESVFEAANDDGSLAGFKILRTICADCGKWLSDKLP